MPTIGLIGLGNAGRPIGERILALGYTLTVYDLNHTTSGDYGPAVARALPLLPRTLFQTSH